VYRHPKSGDIKLDRSVNRAVFDVQMLVMEGMSIDWLKAHSEEVVERFATLCLADRVFADAVSRATADKSRMSYRLLTWKNALAELGADVPAAARIPV
jgi:hypothetical protein